ncbi:hypothetical protein Hanom_Chr16g01492621 [Helianthus anomalus]
MGFGVTHVLDGNRIGSGQVSGRHGFLHGTGFGSQRVLGRHEFPHETIFGSGRVSYRFDAYRFDLYRFDANPFRSGVSFKMFLLPHELLANLVVLGHSMI